MWHYERNKDNTARYILGQEGPRPLVCIGVNPSTAEPNALDPTLRTVKNTSIRRGYDGWLMLNLYPQRATCPADLHDALYRRWHQSNVQWAQRYIKPLSQPVIWAAWGTLIEKRPYLGQCLCDLYQAFGSTQAQWIRIGALSKAGHPHHPLYLSRQAELAPFNIKDYLKRWM